MPSARSVYISASCNRASNVASSRSSDGLIAYGSGRFVALWHSAASKGVHQTLPGHQGVVTTVKFVSDSVLASGDAAGIVRLWKQVDGIWTPLAVLPRHDQSISALAVLDLAQEQISLVVSGSSDGAVKTRSVGNATGEIRNIQDVDLKGKIPLEMALSLFPGGKSVILAVGTTSPLLTLFCSPLESLFFTKALSLEGHADWIRALSFYKPPPPSPTTSTPSPQYDLLPTELLLASGSQDAYIRLWRFTPLSPSDSSAAKAPETDPLLLALEKADLAEQEIRLKAFDFVVSPHEAYACSSEAVLLGHDSWVTNLHWSPTTPFSLLSSSADRSLILWTPSSSEEGGVWTPNKRFGEFTSPTNLGFFGALWGKGGTGLMANGWGGAMHFWSLAEGTQEWNPSLGISGHGGRVAEVVWDREGEWVMSCGDDMSTRLHGAWKREEQESWHEIARPQIHGYPIASIAFHPTDRLSFVSGADEKIVRVFEAPGNFIKAAETVSGVKGLGDTDARPMAANVPPLGLSNRAVASTVEAAQIAAVESKDPFDLPQVVDFTVTSHPPFEEQLLGSTLWPETEKIYGHGFEILTLCSTNSSSNHPVSPFPPLIATACKSTSPEHAVIRLFSPADSWKPFGEPLKGHQLTITKLRFSQSNRWLLSVSRDRSWRLFERGSNGFYAPSANATAHARIIWDCSWALDDSFFVTASRDKTAKVWTLSGDNSWQCSATLKMAEAATAVAITRLEETERHLLAVGLENGAIHTFTSPFGSDATQWTPYIVIDSTVGHCQAVTTLAFSPKPSAHGGVRLASGSEDRSMRVIDLDEE